MDARGQMYMAIDELVLAEDRQRLKEAERQLETVMATGKPEYAPPGRKWKKKTEGSSELRHYRNLRKNNAS